MFSVCYVLCLCFVFEVLTGTKKNFSFELATQPFLVCINIFCLCCILCMFDKGNIYIICDVPVCSSVYKAINQRVCLWYVCILVVPGPVHIYPPVLVTVFM